jgi:23S rRNA pseudoU1915 N3-methylase RlmH
MIDNTATPEGDHEPGRQGQPLTSEALAKSRQNLNTHHALAVPLGGMAGWQKRCDSTAGSAFR